MMQDHVLLAAGWIVYGVLHSAMASLTFKHLLQKKLQEKYRYYRLFYTLFAFAGLAVLLVLLYTIQSSYVIHPVLWMRIAGMVIGITGMLLMAVCIRKYFFSLSGLKSLVTESHHDQLMISGIHRYVRHPLYLGTFAFIWGGWLLWPTYSFLITNLIITVYTLIGIQLEEKKLINLFGEAYVHYQQNVPSLLPFRRKNLYRKETADGNPAFTDSSPLS